ncbi:MAG: serine hydrolase [Thermoanaerobaculia bacterium]
MRRSLLLALFLAAFLAAPTLRAQGSPGARAVLDYLAARPADVAMISYSVGADGEPLTDDPVIAHRADREMSLASVAKLLVAGAYALEVDAARLSPEELVPVGVWDHYYLGLDHHAEALRELGIATDELGFASDPSTPVALESMARAMIRWSDNAAFDYFVGRLGQPAIAAAAAAAGIPFYGPYLPYSGTDLVWYSHVDGPLAGDKLLDLLALDRGTYEARVAERLALAADPEWAAAELEWRIDGGDARDFDREATAVRAFDHRAPARAVARFLAQIASDRFGSPAASARVRDLIDSGARPPGPFDYWGRKGGSLAAVLDDASVFFVAHGDFAGRKRVTVVFISGIWQPLWELAQADPSLLFEFEVNVALDRGFAAEVATRLQEP